MLTGPVVTSTVNIMSQIKNLVENVCDLYENGVEPEAIAFGLEVKVKLVTDILKLRGSQTSASTLFPSSVPY